MNSKERLKDLKIIVRTIMLGSVQLSMGRAKTETKTKNQHQDQNIPGALPIQFHIINHYKWKK